MNTTSMMMAMICGHRPGNRRRLCSSGTRVRPTAERTWNAHREGSVLFFSYCWFSFAASLCGVATEPTLPRSSPSGRLLLRPRRPARTTPTPATTMNGLRLRGCGGRHLLRVRHLLGNSLRRTTGTTWAPCSTSPTTTAPTVLRSLPRGDAAEQRLDRGADFLLHHVADHRHEASLSRHRVLLAGARYTKGRSPAKSGAQRPEW